MLPLGTGHLLVPRQSMANCETSTAPGVRACQLGSTMHRSNQVNRMSVAAVQNPFRADVARIHQVLGWQQITCGQIGLNGVERVVILLRGWGGGDLGNQVRQLVLTAFRHVDLVADPLPSPLATDSARRGRRGSAATPPPAAVPAA